MLSCFFVSLSSSYSFSGLLSLVFLLSISFFFLLLLFHFFLSTFSLFSYFVINALFSSLSFSTQCDIFFSLFSFSRHYCQHFSPYLVTHIFVSANRKVSLFFCVFPPLAIASSLFCLFVCYCRSPSSFSQWLSPSSFLPVM